MFAVGARRVTGGLLSPYQNNRRILVRKQPARVTAALTPWNFPLTMVTHKAGPGARQQIDRAGTFLAPKVITDVAADALFCRDETCEPVAALVRHETEEEAITLANDADARLAACVYTRDIDRGWRAPEPLDYGMVGVNTELISTEVALFGGIKQSDLGRGGAPYGVDDYLDIKLDCAAVESRYLLKLHIVVDYMVPQVHASLNAYPISAGAR